MYALRDGTYGHRHAPGQHSAAAVINLPSPMEHTTTAVSVLHLRHPNNVVPSFSHIRSLGLGIALVVIGTLCVVFNIVNICFIDQVGWVVYVTGNGFWAGCMCLTSGGLCIAASRNKTRLLIAGCVLADIAASFLALQQLVVGVRGAVWAQHLCTYQRLLNEDDKCHVGLVTTAMEASLAAVAILAIIASIWSLVISCKALGCCALASTAQFGSVTDREVSTPASPSAAGPGPGPASVVYHHGSDDVTTAAPTHAVRNSRYAALY